MWAITESHMPRRDSTSSPPHSGGLHGKQESREPRRARRFASLFIHARTGWRQQLEHAGAAWSSTSAVCVMDLV